MKYIFIIISLVLLFGCTETPNEIPIDSYRDVVFNADMSDYIAEGLFDADTDILRLKGDFNNWGTNLIMTESRDEGVYSLEIIDLVLGKTYEYRYCINDSLEALDGSNREYQVLNENNNVTNYYNELDPTIVIFRVNMNNTDFDPDEDTVDVPGNFNEWSEANPLTDEDNDGVFELILSTIDVGYILEYKFRINYNWDLAELEGQDNRVYTVVQGENLLEHEFDVP